MPIYKQNEKNKDGLYKYKVRISYVEDGKRKQLTRVAYGLKEAKMLEATLLTERDKSPSEMTLNELHEEYINNAKGEIREISVFEKQREYDAYIREFLGNYKIEDLTVKRLTDWKNHINSLDLALNTRKSAYWELNSTLNFAVNLDYLESNQLKKISNFKDAYSEKSSINFYTAEEFKIYKTAAFEHVQKQQKYDHYVFFCLAYYTGCRKGEIHALRWSSIEGDILHITKSIVQRKLKFDVETPPKTRGSIRDIQIPVPMLKILEEHKKWWKNKIELIGEEWNEDAFICGYYRPLRDSGIDKMNATIAKKAGLKKIRIHDFRHSHASLLINNGINALEVAKRLGHSTVDQTLKTYAHLFPKESERAIQVLNQIE